MKEEKGIEMGFPICIRQKSENLKSSFFLIFFVISIVVGIFIVGLILFLKRGGYGY